MQQEPGRAKLAIGLGAVFVVAAILAIWIGLVIYVLWGVLGWTGIIPVIGVGLVIIGVGVATWAFRRLPPTSR